MSTPTSRGAEGTERPWEALLAPEPGPGVASDDPDTVAP